MGITRRRGFLKWAAAGILSFLGINRDVHSLSTSPEEFLPETPPGYVLWNKYAKAFSTPKGWEMYSRCCYVRVFGDCAVNDEILEWREKFLRSWRCCHGGVEYRIRPTFLNIDFILGIIQWRAEGSGV